MAARTLLVVSFLAISPRYLLAKLIITEIHYHPSGPTGDAEGLEFVEFFNDEPLPFDMSGYQIVGGITYTFPGGTVVDGGKAVLVAANPDHLASSYGVEKPLGPFSGRLGNDGDELVLVDTGGSSVSIVRYNDRNRWPSAPDGAGPSLVLKDPLLDPGESESWGWSKNRGGTPGTVAFDAVSSNETSEALINEVERSKVGDGWIEIFNPGKALLDLSGYRLTGDAAGQPSYELPSGTRLSPRGFLVVSESEAKVPLNPTDQALFLVAPDGERVVDARRLGERSGETTDGRFPDGSPRWCHMTTATRGSANEKPKTAPIVISEIHYRPYSEDDAEEFIEVTNTGSEPVDLEGIAFTSGIDYAFPPSTLVQPGQYLVVAKDPARLAELYQISGVLGPYKGVLSNAGELVRLSDRWGNPVDEVRYFDGGSWPAWPDGDGPSLELTDLRQDNSAASAWQESDHGKTSQWVQYEYTGTQRGGDSEFQLYLLGAGETLVDDIEVFPADGGPNHIPNGTFDGADPLAGWVIDGTHIDSRIEPGGGPDGSNALRVVASKRGDTGANHIERQTTPNLLAGKGYKVRFKARWLMGSDLIMTRSWNHGFPKVTRLSVPPLGGTPGSRNSRALPANPPGAVESSGPVITSVEQRPALPQPGEAVTVTAKITDPDGVASATLNFRLDGSPTFTQSPMRDDGVEPDLIAGDGIHAGRIEGTGSRGAVAELYLEAVDGKGLRRLSPPEAPERTLVYQYDDGIPRNAVPAYRLVLLKKDHQTLLRRAPTSNHHLPASLIYRDERIFHLAGLRYRGSPFLRRSQITGPRKGFRVRLSDENPLFGSVRVTLDEQEADPTLQIDRLVRGFLQTAGDIPYGERRHVHMIFQGASFGGYEHVLTVDPLYLKRAFGEGKDGGDLYKIDAHYEIDDRGEFPFPAFTSWKYTDDKEALRFTYKKRAREKEDDFSSLMQLLELMDVAKTSSEEFDARAPGLIDLSLWVKGIAVYRAVEDWDTIGGWTGKNVYLYHHPDGRWRYIPWDHDVAFGSAALQPDQNPRAYLYTPYFPEVRRLLERPSLDRKFNGELERLLKEDYTREAVDPVLDRTYQLLQGTTGAASPGDIKTFLSARRTFLLSKVKGPEVFTIETNGGQPFSTAEPVALLSGKAPFQVESIVQGDKLSALRWKDKETWETNVPLRPGENAIDLFAFNAPGELVGSAGIRITYDAAPGSFTRGDANRDAKVDLADGVAVLHYLFLEGALDCLDAADVDDSGQINITDPIVLLRHLFQGGSAPPPPFAAPGLDSTPDGLECLSK
jgi:hypothetical protein